VNGVQYNFGDVLAENGKTCLVLLRHFGWVTCRRSADRLTQIHSYFQRLGVHLVAIGSGTARMAMDFKQKQNFAGQIYVDPSRTIYDDLNCKRGWKAVRKTLNEISSIADLTYF
jgi:peroxiredoxin